VGDERSGSGASHFKHIKNDDARRGSVPATPAEIGTLKEASPFSLSLAEKITKILDNPF